MKILFLSHTYWDSKFRVGSHQLANQYLKNGHEVYYISSPLSFFHLLKNDYDIKKRFKTRFPRKKNNLFTYIPFRFIPFKNFIFFRNIKHAIHSSMIFRRKFIKISKKFFPDEFDIVLIDTPHLAFMLKLINYNKVFYRITDFYAYMNGKYFKEIENVEAYIIKELSIPVITTSNPIKEYYDSKYSINSFLLENGVDIGHFQCKKKWKRPIEYSDKKIIVYVGALDQRFDWNLVYEISKSFIETDIYIIGPTEHPKEVNNLHIIGSRAYEEIPSYLFYADLGILPFVKSHENEGRSPMKIYEYGICGLPTVATTTAELKRRNNSFVFLSNDTEEFLNNIDYCLNNSMTVIKQNAKKESMTHGWDIIAKKILEL